MSEDAGGGEVAFGRMRVAATGWWIAQFEQTATGVAISLTPSETFARVFLSPPDELRATIIAHLGAVDFEPASYAEWIEQRDAPKL